MALCDSCGYSRILILMPILACVILALVVTLPQHTDPVAVHYDAVVIGTDGMAPIAVQPRAPPAA